MTICFGQAPAFGSAVLRIGPGCTGITPIVQVLRNDVVFGIALRPGQRGAVAAEQTPEGDIASGMLRIGDLP